MMKALILIPCCDRKKESTSVSQSSLALEGLSHLRKDLVAMVKETHSLISKPENKNTLVDGMGNITLAVDLYDGKLYNACRARIVSALYGLVQLDEGIKIYNLQMGDKLSNGQKISEYWQAKGLSSILMQYALKTGTNVIWSLLPKVGYHKVFSNFWAEAREKSMDCFRVDIPGVRNASGYLRGAWIDYIIRKNSRYLLLDPPPPSAIPASNRPFAYPRC
jgi:cytoplasmic iron level regulating protein YaaA (DUF328/UPF0246 family)